MIVSNEFIQQTADGYDMPYEWVQLIVNQCKDFDQLYEALESELDTEQRIAMANKLEIDDD